jgi:hypothetical protein
MADNPDQKNKNPHTPERDWISWLSDRLSFPFEVVRIDDDDKSMMFGGGDSEPFRIDHKMKALALDSEEDLYGVIIKVREGRRIGYVPLLDLEVTDKLGFRTSRCAKRRRAAMGLLIRE